MYRTFAVFLALALAHPAQAKVCDYRLSALISKAGPSATAGDTGGTAGSVLRDAGYYTLTHAATGSTMLGAVLGGDSTAGKIGMIAGAGKAVGAAASAMSPPALIAGAVVAVIAGGVEGVCYFRDERITDYETIDKLMRELAGQADPEYFRYSEGTPMPEDSRIFVRLDGDETVEMMISRLYIVNGTLMHRDFLRNTVVGNIGFILPGNASE